MLTSCNSDVLLSEKWEWKNQEWVVDDPRMITIESTDTTALYSLDLEVEHARSYPFRNIYIRTRTTFPSGKEITSVTSLELTDALGHWAGDCGRKNCTLELPLQSRFTFPESGTYTWTIEPFMRMDTIRGISSLTVTCRRKSL